MKDKNNITEEKDLLLIDEIKEVLEAKIGFTVESFRILCITEQNPFGEFIDYSAKYNIARRIKRKKILLDRITDLLGRMFAFFGFDGGKKKTT